MFPTRKETAFWICVNQAQVFIHRKIDQKLKAAGLPPLRWYDVLWALEQAEDSGMRPFELEKSLLFEQSNLSHLLRRLISEGLVSQTVYSKDRRGKIIKITAQGQIVRRNMWDIYGPALHASVALQDETLDHEDLTNVLKSMIARDGQGAG